MKSFAMAVVIVTVTAPAATAEETAQRDDHWAPLRPLVGKRKGKRDGLGGKAKQTVEE